MSHIIQARGLWFDLSPPFRFYLQRPSEHDSTWQETTGWTTLQTMYQKYPLYKNENYNFCIIRIMP